eukprot:403355199
MSQISEPHLTAPKPKPNPLLQPNIMLPPGWIHFDIYQNQRVYYNYHSKQFSFSPIFNTVDFLYTFQKPTLPPISLEDLNSKLSLIEEDIKQRNNGELPQPPRSLSDQIEELIKIYSQRGSQIKKTQANLDTANQSQSMAVQQNQMSLPDQNLTEMQKNERLFKQALKKYVTDKKLNQIKGCTRTTEQISLLMQICQQIFQLSPSFQYKDINEGREKFLCMIDFQGIPISSGKGHNKSESKKTAAQNALKVIAPKVYKEVFGEDPTPSSNSPLPKSQSLQNISPNASQAQNQVQHLPTAQPTTVSPSQKQQKSNKSLTSLLSQSQVNTGSQSQTSKAQPLFVSQRLAQNVGDQSHDDQRSKSRTKIVMRKNLQEEVKLPDQVMNLNYQEFDILPTDENLQEITLSHSNFLKIGHLFTTYTPYTILKIYSQKNNLSFDEHLQNQKSRDPNKVLSFEIRLSDITSRQQRYCHMAYGPNREQARIKAALHILQQIFTPHKRWLELVKEIQDQVYNDRIRRGVGEKPTLQKYDKETNKFTKDWKQKLQVNSQHQADADIDDYGEESDQEMDGEDDSEDEQESDDDTPHQMQQKTVLQKKQTAKSSLIRTNKPQKDPQDASGNPAGKASDFGETECIEID